MQKPEAAGGILFDIEAHLAPLGWYYEDLYENPSLVKDLNVYILNLQTEDFILSENECHLGTKYYEDERKKLDLNMRKRWRSTSWSVADRRDYRNADRRSKLSLTRLSAVRAERSKVSYLMKEVTTALIAMANANHYQSRLPSAYSKEALDFP